MAGKAFYLKNILWLGIAVAYKPDQTKAFSFSKFKIAITQLKRQVTN